VQQGTPAICPSSRKTNASPISASRTGIAGNNALHSVEYWNIAGRNKAQQKADHSIFFFGGSEKILRMPRNGFQFRGRS